MKAHSDTANYVCTNNVLKEAQTKSPNNAEMTKNKIMEDVNDGIWNKNENLNRIQNAIRTRPPPERDQTVGENKGCEDQRHSQMGVLESHYMWTQN